MICFFVPEKWCITKWAYLRKISFSEPIRLQDFIISRRNQSRPSGTIWDHPSFSGWAWLVVPLVYSNCRILWSSICLEKVSWHLNFYHGVCHHWKVTFNTTSIGWALSVVLFVLSDGRIVWSLISLERNQFIYIYIYICIKNIITSCISIDDPFLLNKKDLQGVISNI